MISDQAAAAGVAVDVLVEPEPRDTLPAIAAAVEWLARRDPDAALFVLPSDHLIPDAAAFAAAAQAALTAAATGALVAFGVRPSGPATGYGYIRPGAAVDDATMDLDALRLGAGFADAPKISFDYGVMEKTSRAAVIEASFAWSDIGDWRELWAQSPKDGDGVAREGDAVAIDCRDSYLRSGGRLVCAICVEGLAVIDTPDAVMVAPLARAQEVKGLVASLAASGRREATEPARVHRPWGWYQTMDLGERFRVKRIQVSPGKKLSLQKHHHRAEHWVVVRGTAEVTRDGETIMLRENESVYLPLGCVHRLANPGMIPLKIIEVQTGAYLEEDDIVRFDDDFGRA